MDAIEIPDAVKVLSTSLHSQNAFSTMRKSNQMVTAAYNDFSEIFAGAFRRHLDQANSAWQAMAKAESMKDAMAAQTDYIHQYIQSAITGLGRLSEASHRMAHVVMASATVKPNVEIANT